MDKEYDVRVTSYALEQMGEIARYIANTLQAPDTARKWLAKLQEEIQSLSFLPARIALTEEEPWHSQGVYKTVVGNHLVYFWINEETLTVWITAVVYARREQRQQLQSIE